MDRETYQNLNLKNGWDLPKGEKPPLTGRKQNLVRAYELLVKKTDEEYLQEKEHRKQLVPSLREREQAVSRDYGQETCRDSKKAAVQETEFRNCEEAGKAVLPDAAKEVAWQAELLDTTGEKYRRTRKKQLLTAGIAVAAAAVIFIAKLLVGGVFLTADISAYADVAITVEGLTDEPFEITPKELAKMKLEKIRVEVHEEEVAPDETPELGIAVGPSLDTFLANYDVSPEEIRSMRVYNQNEKSTAYAHTLEDSEVILSVANGHKALGEKEAPLRIAVADTDAYEWTGWVRRIVFVRAESDENNIGEAPE